MGWNMRKEGAARRLLNEHLKTPTERGLNKPFFFIRLTPKPPALLILQRNQSPQLSLKEPEKGPQKVFFLYSGPPPKMAGNP